MSVIAAVLFSIAPAAGAQTVNPDTSTNVCGGANRTCFQIFGSGQFVGRFQSSGHNATGQAIDAEIEIFDNNPPNPTWTQQVQYVAAGTNDYFNPSIGTTLPIGQYCAVFEEMALINGQWQGIQLLGGPECAYVE